LDEVVEDTQSLRILRFRNINKRANLGGLERNVLATHPDLQFLSPILILLWPFTIVFLHDLAGLDDALDLINHEGAYAHLLSDEGIVSIVGIVRISS